MRTIAPVFFIGLILGSWSFAGDTPNKANPELNVTIQLMEVSRGALLDIGIDLSKPESERGPLAGDDFQQKLDDLKKSKRIKILAEPALLVAVNQKGTSFNGGEFAVPVPTSDGELKEEKREFGIRAEVTPSPQEDGRVKLQWYISHSNLDQSVGVRINGKLVPGITRRQVQGNVVVSLGEPVFNVVASDKGNVLLVRIIAESEGK